MSQSMNMISGSQVRIASSAKPVGHFDHRFGGEIRQHRARQAAHIGIAVDDQDVETLDQLSERLVGNCLAYPP